MKQGVLRRLGIFLQASGICLLTAGALFTGRAVLEENVSGTQTGEVLAAYMSAQEKEAEKMTSAAAETYSSPADAAVKDTGSAEAEDGGAVQYDTVVEIDGEIYVGLLSLPGLGMDLPVNGSISDQALFRSPCVFCGSCEDGDLIIAGHNYRTQFNRVKNELQKGDQVVYTLADGKKHTYTVESTEVIGPDAADALCADTGWDLTLFTCTAGGDRRYIVRCTEVF